MLVKRSLSILIVICFSAASAFSQTLTQADRDRALQYLESTRQGVLDATAGLSETQWNFKPAPDKWSVAQVMEHIAAAEDFLMAMVTTQVMKAPARPAGGDYVKAIDDMVVAKIPDRSKKAHAPEPLIPTNRYGSPDASLKHFIDARAPDRNLSEDPRRSSRTCHRVPWVKKLADTSGSCLPHDTANATPSKSTK